MNIHSSPGEPGDEPHHFSQEAATVEPPAPPAEGDDPSHFRHDEFTGASEQGDAVLPPFDLADEPAHFRESEAIPEEDEDEERESA